MHSINRESLRHVRFPDDVSVRFIRIGGFEFLIHCFRTVRLHRPIIRETRQTHLVNHDARQRLTRGIRRDDDARPRMAQTRNLWHTALIRHNRIRAFRLINHEDNRTRELADSTSSLEVSVNSKHRHLMLAAFQPAHSADIIRFIVNEGEFHPTPVQQIFHCRRTKNRIPRKRIVRHLNLVCITLRARLLQEVAAQPRLNDELIDESDYPDNNQPTRHHDDFAFFHIDIHNV